MSRVIVVGAGWAGCAAAVQAAKAGAEVLLLERTDMLLGTGQVGGIMRNNGRFTATEEMIALGGGDLFEVIEQNLKHKNINFPGHKHADLYNVAVISGAIEQNLKRKNITIVYQCRITNLQKEKDRILSVEDSNHNTYEGDVFIDATGTAGPMNNCGKYGNGCAMCVLRCPCFGGRVSLTALSGITEMQGIRPDGMIGAMSGSCKILKESLSQELQNKLNQDGVVVVPVPEELQRDHLSLKCCQQYALHEYKDHMILLDTGHAKLMTPFYAVEELHQIPGFENARYEDPYGAGKGNSMRFFAMAPRDNQMRVIGMDNLFCCGEKSGLIVGHTEAIITGVLAGYNSVQYIKNKEKLTLPESLAVGDMIATVNKKMKTKQGRMKKYTFAGSVYFERMKKLSLYSVDRDEIVSRVKQTELYNVFNGV